MKNIKIVNINFDTRIKVVIVISCIIAVSIIIYSTYYIFSLNQEEMVDLENIEEIAYVSGYSASYTVTVNSNKNENTYNVSENVDFNTNTYEMLIDDNLKINITGSEISINNSHSDYEYLVTNNGEILTNNAISFSSVIKCIEKILSCEISGKITKIEQDDKIIFEIFTDEEYISHINTIYLYVLKSECKITEVKMYNFDKIEQYCFNFEYITLKK